MMRMTGHAPGIVDTKEFHMPARKGTAHWEGSLKEGGGTVALGSGAFEGQYGYRSRFEDGPGTNPEELIGAAHAGCFSMAFALALSDAGHVPDSVDTTATVHFGPDPSGEGFAISRIDLVTNAAVPGIEPARFDELADAAKAGCPVSKALAAVEITLDATLAG
jgi:osmotically inducible protein OsmC